MDTVETGPANMPALGLGTYRLRGRECAQTVRTALSLGYRHIDTAAFYDNHAAIGRAIDSTLVPRHELFLTTKLWKTNLEREAARQSTLDSLNELGVEYVDLLLIHWPNERIPIEETIAAMNRLQADDKVRHIGVSNFSIQQLQEAMAVSETPIVTNQVEYNPDTDQQALLEYCLANDVALTAYSPLAKGSVATDDVLAEIGARYGKSAAQVALRWLVQQEGVAAIPKAESQAHLEANLDIFDFELTDTEMLRIFDRQGGLSDSLRSHFGLGS